MTGKVFQTSYADAYDRTRVNAVSFIMILKNRYIEVRVFNNPYKEPMIWNYPMTSNIRQQYAKKQAIFQW